MKKKRIAFLVEEDFCSRHFGVWNFLSTIKRLLEEEAFVEYVIYTRCHTGFLWYRVLANNEGRGFESKKIVLEGKKINKFNIKKFNKAAKQNLEKTRNLYSFQYLGQDLKEQDYDICIITNPILLALDVNIDAKKIYGIVYDFIPNVYVLNNRTVNDFVFANRHYVGYEFYNSKCDKILCDSEETARQYKEFFPSVPKEKIDFFLPFPPYEFRNEKFSDGDKKENSVILAAPFDLRKGLKKIPSLINPVSDKIDTLYVFGSIRCSENDFNTFFKEITVKRIVYFPKISYKDLIELYKKCKVLLFPSSEEGLGIPLIEAQICGCRVVTTNASPMKDLVLEGSKVLSETSDDLAIIGRMLDDDFDYVELSRTARERFSYEKVLKKIIG